MNNTDEQSARPMITSFGTHDLVHILALVSIVGALYVLLAGLTPRIVVLPGVVSLQAALSITIVAGLLFGLPGAVAVGLGYGLFSVLTGAAGLTTVTGMVATVLMGLVAHRSWGELPYVSSGDCPGTRSAWASVEFLGVSILAVISGIPIMAWGTSVTRTRPYFVTAVGDFLGYAASAVVIGLPLLLLIGPTINRLGISRPTQSSGNLMLIPVLSLVWITVGSITSIGFSLFEIVPAREFIVRDLGVLLILENRMLFGRGGWKVQLVVGVMFLTAILISMDSTVFSRRG